MLVKFHAGYVSSGLQWLHGLCCVEICLKGIDMLGTLYAGYVRGSIEALRLVVKHRQAGEVPCRLR